MGILNVSKNKNLGVAFIAGILVAIFVGHAYIVYQTRAMTIQNTNDIAQIASFLQQATGSTNTTPIDNSAE